jgi:hypothetical protein
MSTSSQISAGHTQDPAEFLLKFMRYLGMFGLVGGLGALAAMWAFGPRPETAEQWQVLIGAMRPVFYACFFAGVVILVIAGVISWWKHRQALHAARWFKAMMVMVFVAIPALHFTSRSIALRLYAALDEGRLEEAAALWNQLGWMFLIGFVVMLIIAGIGILKPRLGQRVESHG